MTVAAGDEEIVGAGHLHDVLKGWIEREQGVEKSRSREVEEDREQFSRLTLLDVKDAPFCDRVVIDRLLLRKSTPGYAAGEGTLSMAVQLSILPEIAGSRAYLACEDNLAFMRDLPTESMKLIVTSPPYNIGKAYERRKTLDNYLAAQAQVISECVRLLHPQGSLCWQVGNHITPDGEVVPLDIALYHIFKDHGLVLRNRIVWHFEHGLHCSKRFSGRYETIMWFTKGADYTFNLDPVRVPSKYPNKRHFKGPRIGELSGNPLGKNPSDVWVIPNVKNNHIEKTIHPCQFPVELIERLVLSMTNAGDHVFDPYVGVGSSVIAALKHDRTGYGCDVVQEYIDIAWERVRELRAGTLRTRPMGKPVYDPKLPGGGH